MSDLRRPTPRTSWPAVRPASRQCGWVEQAKTVERLEPRRLLSSGQPGAPSAPVHIALVAGASAFSYNDFSSTTGLICNGFGASSVTADNALVLTDDQDEEARSVWFSQPVAFGNFQTSFTFSIGSGLDGLADGFTFTLQSDGTSALGNDGSSLGYETIPRSVALAFNLFNSGHFGSEFGIAVDGQHPPDVTDTSMTPINLHAGDTFDATVSYNGTNLSLTVTDLMQADTSFTTSQAIDIPAFLGSDEAFVGFTAATGSLDSTQQLLAWSYNASNAPTIVDPAAASSAVVVGNSVDLSALAQGINGPDALTYDWSAVSMPSGARAPGFSDNDSSNALNVAVELFKAGHYRFRCTITDRSDLSISSDVLVDVAQQPTSLRIAEHKQVIDLGQQFAYTAYVTDQFGKPMKTDPTIDFEVLDGPGAINMLSGLYSSSDIKGHAVIEASADGLVGTVGALLIA
jgi:hypothetical protein